MILTGNRRAGRKASKSPWHFVHQESCVNWSGRKSGLRGEKQAANCLSYGTAMSLYCACTCCSFVFVLYLRLAVWLLMRHNNNKDYYYSIISVFYYVQIYYVLGTRMF